MYRTDEEGDNEWLRALKQAREQGIYKGKQIAAVEQAHLSGEDETGSTPENISWFSVEEESGEVSISRPLEELSDKDLVNAIKKIGAVATRMESLEKYLTHIDPEIDAYLTNIASQFRGFKSKFQAEKEFRENISTTVLPPWDPEDKPSGISLETYRRKFAYTEVDTVCEELSLSQGVVEKAEHFIAHAYSTWDLEFSPQATIAGAVYLACNILNEPILREEVQVVVGVSEQELLSAFRTLAVKSGHPRYSTPDWRPPDQWPKEEKLESESVLPERDPVDNDPYEYAQTHLHAVITELGAPDMIETRAQEFVDIIFEVDPDMTDPAIRLGTAVYLSLIEHGNITSLEQVAEAVGVPKYTIERVLGEILKAGES